MNLGVWKVNWESYNADFLFLLWHSQHNAIERTFGPVIRIFCVTQGTKPLFSLCTQTLEGILAIRCLLWNVLNYSYFQLQIRFLTPSKSSLQSAWKGGYIVFCPYYSSCAVVSCGNYNSVSYMSWAYQCSLTCEAPILTREFLMDLL